MAKQHNCVCPLWLATFSYKPCLPQLILLEASWSQTKATCPYILEPRLQWCENMLPLNSIKAEPAEAEPYTIQQVGWWNVCHHRLAVWLAVRHYCCNVCSGGATGLVGPVLTGPLNEKINWGRCFPLYC